MALLPVLLDIVDEIYSNLDNPEKTLGDIPMLFVPHCRRRERGCPGKKEHGHQGPQHGEHHGSHGEHHGSHGEHHGPHGSYEHHGHHGRHGSHSPKRAECPEGKAEGHRRGRCGRKERQEESNCRFGESRGHCLYRGFASCPRFASRGCPCKKTSSDDFKVAFDVKPFNLDEISVKVKGREIFVDGKHDERQDEQGFVSRQFTRRFQVPDDYDIDTVATFLDAEGSMTIVVNKPKPAVDESSERIIPIERVASVREEENNSDGPEAFELMDEDTNDSKKNE